MLRKGRELIGYQGHLDGAGVIHLVFEGCFLGGSAFHFIHIDGERVLHHLKGVVQHPHLVDGLHVRQGRREVAHGHFLGRTGKEMKRLGGIPNHLAADEIDGDKPQEYDYQDNGVQHASFVCDDLLRHHDGNHPVHTLHCPIVYPRGNTVNFHQCRALLSFLHTGHHFGVHLIARTFRLFKEVGIEDALFIGMQDIDAVMVGHKVITVMPAALLILPDDFLQVVGHLVFQIFQRQVSTNHCHRLSLPVMNRQTIRHQLPPSCNTRNEILLEIHIRPETLVFLYAILKPLPVQIGIAVVLDVLQMYRSDRVMSGDEFQTVFPVREIVWLINNAIGNNRGIDLQYTF